MRFDDDQEFSADTMILSEIQKRGSCLRNIDQARLRLSLRLEENRALRRAIAARQRHSFASNERFGIRADGRMR